MTNTESLCGKYECISGIHSRIAKGFQARWLTVGLLLAFSLSSCGGYVARGRRLYEEGRYIESAEVLQKHENDLQTESPNRRAEYATYRGLSMLVLGNFNEAQQWMLHAYDIERQYPGALRPLWRRDLDRGWRQLKMQQSSQVMLK